MGLAAAVSLLAGAGHAQSGPEAPLARVGLEQRIGALSADPAANGFELGLLGVLRAVEKTLQTRYEYGLGDRIVRLPLLRLSAQGLRNATPKPATPETLSQMIDGFVLDMAETQKVLAAAERTGVQAFDLTLQDLWFDVNRNGARDAGEDAVEILMPVLLDARTRRALKNSEGLDTPIRVRFDTADHAWLSAYTHMLAGVGSLFLAFDPAPVLAGLERGRADLKQAPVIANFYDQAAIRAEIAALEAKTAEVKAREAELRAVLKPDNDKIRVLRNERRKPENKDRRQEFDAEINALQDEIKPRQDLVNDLSRQSRFLRNEKRAAEGKLAQAEAGPDAPALNMAQIRDEGMALSRQRRELMVEQARISRQIKALERQAAEPGSAAGRAGIEAEIAAARSAADKTTSALRDNSTRANELKEAIRDAQRNGTLRTNAEDTVTMVRPAVDLIYIVLKALEQQPDPARIRAAHDNLLNMIAFNRVFWRELGKEADNEAEWIPNPAQISALGIEVGADLAGAWQSILADAEAVLEGRLLVPHPLLPDGYGIDVSAYVRDPGPIDLMAWIQGIGAYPYGARGPRITAQSWRAFSRLSQGRAAVFSLYFN